MPTVEAERGARLVCSSGRKGQRKAVAERIDNSSIVDFSHQAEKMKLARFKSIRSRAGRV